MKPCRKKHKRRKKVFTKKGRNGKKIRYVLTKKGKSYLKGNKKPPHLK